MQSIVVTGVSSGIGWGTTKVLIEHGFHVFGSVRKAEDAQRLSVEWGDRFTPLLFDITDEKAVQLAAQQVRDRLNGEPLLGLVNNAGMAVGGPLMHMPIDEFRYQVEVNLTGALIVTQAFLPQLGSDRSLTGKPGRIVNVSSVGGKSGAPFLGAYAAAKHGLEGLSESLRRELMLYGIDVIIIGPGAIVTPIWDKAKQIDASAYKGTAYEKFLRSFQAYIVREGRKGLPPERVGEVILKALTIPRPRVRYTVVSQPLMDWITSTLLPKRVLDGIIARNLGFTQKS